jgi:hypothetical protein
METAQALQASQTEQIEDGDLVMGVIDGIVD